MMDMSSMGDKLMSTNDAIHIYAGILVMCIVMNLLTNNLIIRICMNASVYLHKTMFENLIHATMNFFNKNPSGKPLGLRFTRKHFWSNLKIIFFYQVRY